MSGAPLSVAQRALKRAALLSSAPVKPVRFPGSRPVPDVPMPEVNELSESMLWGMNTGKPAIPLLRAHLSREGRLTLDAAQRLVREAMAILDKEPNLLRVSAPITVVGDIHGQFYDLMSIADLAGQPAENNRFLFLGDYVDRGAFSMEVLFYLLACKINYPDSVYLLRGNHESRRLSSFMSFGPECKHKYGEQLFEELQELFCTLPLAAVVSNTSFGDCFCVHAGIGPTLGLLGDIDKEDRFNEIPDTGLLTDLTWSDPDKEWNPCVRECIGWSKARWATRGFTHNVYRDISFNYGPEVTRRFLERNNLACIIRGHEAEDEGYKRHFCEEGDTGVPPVLTLFSCPNYCDSYGNRGAYLKIESGGVHIYQINYSLHPATLPGHTDAFSYSIPFITETVIQLLRILVRMPDEENLTDDQKASDEILATRARQLWAKSQRIREQQEEYRRVLLADYHEKMPRFEQMLILDRENESVPKASDSGMTLSVGAGRGRNFLKKSI
eukprot:m51a1_g14589 hypothetical protein (498) ;mRNA; f:1147307-1149510